MESPFAQHLHTNYVPSDSEVLAIRSHLIPYALEAARLETLIKDLSAQRQDIIDYIAPHDVLISPVRRLPRDILQEIFLACLPDYRNAVMSVTEAPLLLARICSTWRILVLSTPALWATLHIPLQHIFMSDLHGPLTEWLQRSKRCPQSISIFGARNMELWEDQSPSYVDAILEAIFSCADRWHTLELSFEVNGSMLRFRDVYPPALVAVTLQGPASVVRQLKLLTTPSLRAVTLRILNDFDAYVPRLPIIWSNLTHLALDSIGRFERQGLSPSVAIEVLRRCPRLISFKSDINDPLQQWDSPESPLQTPVFLPALRELIICRCSSSVGPISCETLFQNLVMPQLRRLQLPRTGQASRCRPFLGDLARHSPLIKELSIDLVGLARSSLAETLPRLNFLERLFVWDCNSTPSADNPHPPAGAQQLLDLLVPATPLQPPCPMLAELQLNECSSLMEINGEAAIADFARRLLDCGGGHFKNLDVHYRHWMPAIPPDIIADFCARRGLNISTKCHTRLRQRPSSPDSAWKGVKH